MPASADYLTKYLTASNGTNASNGDFEDSSRPKKRRKKDRHHPVNSGTLLIADDDDGLLLSNEKRTAEDDEDGPLLFEGRAKSAEFRKKKTSTWKDVAAPVENDAAPVSRDTQATEQDEADRILTAAANESARRLAEQQDEEAPAIVDGVAIPNPGLVDGEEEEEQGPRMSSGAKAGLQTAADTAALLAAEQAREDEQSRRSSKKKLSKSRSKDTQEDIGPEQETIYRDATGRRIDISLRRAQARAEQQAKQVAERKEREAAMGEVQLQQREQAKQDLEEAKFLTLGRGVDDVELNERQKEEVRWDDPMAEYMAERAAEKEAERGGGKNKGRGRKGDAEAETDGAAVKLRRREFTGAAPPNRYSIKPGWRWDGVDRGNGFEKEWFQARGKKARNENLEYQWAMDE